MKDTAARAAIADSRPMRVAYVDAARAISVFIVIYVHALEVFFMGAASAAPSAFVQWQVLVSFAMPLIFFVSGMVHKRNAVKQAVTNSLALILVACAVHAVGWVIGIVWNDDAVSLSALITPMVKMAGFETTVVWYLVSLAIVRMLHHVATEGGVLIRAGVAIAVALAYVVAASFGKIAFQVGTLLPGLVFYALGHCFSPVLTRAGFSALSLACCALLLAVVMVTAPLNGGCAVSFWEHCPNIPGIGQFGVWIHLGQVGFLPLFFVTAAAGSLAIVLVAKGVSMHLPAFARLLSGIGPRTIHLIILNGLVLSYLQPAVPALLPATVPAVVPVLWALATVALHVAVLPLSERVSGPLVTLARAAAAVVTGFLWRAGRHHGLLKAEAF